MGNYVSYLHPNSFTHSSTLGQIIYKNWTPPRGGGVGWVGRGPPVIDAFHLHHMISCTQNDFMYSNTGYNFVKGAVIISKKGDK